MESEGFFYGVYRAQVKDNQDPDKMGKLQIHCPQIHGDTYPDTWAWPMAPYAGKSFGLWAIPDKDEWVWVMFDHGRPEYPIWCGGWWGDQDVTTDMTQQNVVLAVTEGLKIVINRQDKSILLYRNDQDSILMDDNGITIDTAKDVKVNAQGNVEVQAQQAKVNANEIDMTASQIKLTGEVTITGDLHTTGNSVTDGTNSAHHTHPLNTLLNIALPGA
jgi:phage baseplate assembly protein V